MPIGLFAMFDQIRLDTIVEIMRYWAETLNDHDIRRRVEYLERWTTQGFLGVKSSRGLYPSPAYADSLFLSGGKISTTVAAD
jgi:3-hydroxyacyl-CoA dehydrogenase